jgi:hypothetical protein
MTTYAIIFKGDLLEGFTREAVMAAFQGRGNLSAKQVEQVFSGKKVTLKKGLDRDAAKRFAQDLRAIGMRVIATAPAEPGAGAPADADAGYSILFAGQVVEGFAPEAVKLMAAAKLKFSDTQRDLLFSGRELTMKRGLSEDKARHYLDTLRKLGMNARVSPPLPEREPPAPDPLTQAAEASLVQTQLAQPVYNPEESFHSSSTLEMAQAAAEPEMPMDVHPALRTPPAEPKAVSKPDLLPVEANAQVATVVNDDIVRAYEAELAGPDVDPEVDALRQAHDPAPAPAASVPPPEPSRAPEPEPEPEPEPAPVAAPVDPAPAAAPAPVAPAEETVMGDEAPEPAAPTPTGGLSNRVAVGVVVLLGALIALWILI